MIHLQRTPKIFFKLVIALLSDPLTIASLLNASAALERTGEMAEALRKTAQALEMAEAQKDPHTIGAVLVAESRLRFRMGQYHQSIHLAEKAENLAPPKSTTHADALLLLGMCSAETNSLANAEQFYRQAADLARELGYPLAHCRALHNLSCGVYMPRGQFDLALTSDEEALRVAKLHLLQDWLHFPLITIAWTCHLTGQRQREMDALAELARILPPDWVAYGYYELLIADLALDESNLEKGLELYTRMRSNAEASGEPALIVYARLGLSRYHLLSGNAPTARAWADDALACANQVGYQHLAGKALVERGRTAWKCGDPAAAESDLRAAIQTFTALGAAFDLARSNLYLAAVFFDQHKAEAAAAWAEATRLIRLYGYNSLLQQEHLLVLPLIAANLDSKDLSLAQTSKDFYDQFLQAVPPPLQIKMLGQFAVWVGHTPIPKDALRQRRAGELLALLLIAPKHYLTFQQVAEALCPEKNPDAALDFYHHAVSALRRLLEPNLPDRRFICRYLDVDDEQIKFNLPPGSKIDYQEFETCYQTQAWEQALSSYGGEFLPALRYAEWAIPMRQHLNDLHEQALLALAENRLESGAAAACLELVQQALLHNPWHEQAVSLGMRAALQLGNRTIALRLYLRLEKVLKKDLGINPQEDLLKLYAQAQRRALKR